VRTTQQLLATSVKIGPHLKRMENTNRNLTMTPRESTNEVPQHVEEAHQVMPNHAHAKRERTENGRTDFEGFSPNVYSVI